MRMVLYNAWHIDGTLLNITPSNTVPHVISAVVCFVLSRKIIKDLEMSKRDYWVLFHLSTGRCVVQ